MTNGEDTVHYHSQGLDWTIPTTPYRAQCLNDLRQDYAALDGQAETSDSFRIAPIFIQIGVS